MSVVRTLIGYIKGPKGDTGATGATGAQGPAGADGAPGVNDYASTTKAGLVRVGDDFNINSSNGVLSIKNAFTEASSLANINTGESQATILGKVKKFMTTLMPSNFLINTTNSTATDKALTANMGKTLAGNFATVQTSATASKAYAVGDYLVLNGLFYKVTAAIANGGTISVGTNVTLANVGRQLSNLNDSLHTTNGYIYSGSLPNNTDFNNVTTAGHYVINGGSTYTNTPEGITWGMLEVVRGSADGSSFFQRVSQGDRIYQRYHISSTEWGPWFRYICENENEPLIAYRTYTYAYTISANSNVAIKANEFTPAMTTPTGRLMMGVRAYYTGNSSVVPAAIQHSSGSENVVILKNTSSSSVSGTLTLSFLYIKSSFIGTVS